MGNFIGVFRYFDMTPYSKFQPNWELVEYPYNEMVAENRYVELDEDDMDKLFLLIPDVPITKITKYVLPRFDEENTSCMAKCLRCLEVDIAHKFLSLYTPIGVFTLDRFKESIDITFQTDEQHHKHINKSSKERVNEYFQFKGHELDSAQSALKMHNALKILKQNGSWKYSLLLNNCIQSTNSWYDDMKN